MPTEVRGPANPHRKALIKLLQANANRHHLWDVFADFVELAALAISNSVDRSQFEEREARYLRIVGKYNADEQARFPRMLGELTLAMEAGPDDVLGAVFSELDLGNERVGQFFTPYEVCRLMARVTVGDRNQLRERIDHKGFVTLCEPACGAGAQVIAMAEAMADLGMSYQDQLHVTATDIDARAVHMTYLQLSLLHVPAVIILGNTLTQEVREQWFTPAHVMGMWGAKLHRGYGLGSRRDGQDLAADLDSLVGPLPNTEPASAVDIEPAMPGTSTSVQLDLFDQAA